MRTPFHGAFRAPRAHAGDDGRQRWRQAPVGRQPRAGEDEQQAGHGAWAGALAQDGHSERDRDDGGDVGDDERAPGPDLGDERAEEDEGRRGAEDAEDDQRNERVRRGDGGGRIDRGQRREGHGRDDEARAHRGAGVEVGQRALEDHGAGGIAEGRDQDGRSAQQLVAAPRDVDADQGHDPGQPDDQPDEPRPRRALGVVEAQRQQRDEERHRGDDDRRQRRGDVALARRDEREGHDDLEQRVEREPASAPAQRPERARPPGQGHEHRGAERDAHEGEEGRWHAVVHGDLDEEVRNAPEGRDRREGRPGARAHGAGRYATTIRRPAMAGARARRARAA